MNASKLKCTKRHSKKASYCTLSRSFFTPFWSSHHHAPFCLSHQSLSTSPPFWSRKKSSSTHFLLESSITIHIALFGRGNSHQALTFWSKRLSSARASANSVSVEAQKEMMVSNTQCSCSTTLHRLLCCFDLTEEGRMDEGVSG